MTDPGGELDEVDRARLDDALRESERDVEAGRLISAEDVLRELREQ
jgi:predicted transcriptional regulator